MPIIRLYDSTTLISLILAFAFLLLVLGRQRHPVTIKGTFMVVTGFGNGLGLEIASQAAILGAKKVVLLYEMESEKLKIEASFATLTTEARERLHVLCCSSMDVEEATNLHNKLLKEHGWVEILVNVAAVPAKIHEAVLNDFNISDYKYAIQRRVLYPIQWTKLVWEKMLLNGSGAVVFFYDVVTIHRSFGRSPDAVAEGALRNWVDTLETELQRHKANTLSVFCPSLEVEHNHKILKPRVPWILQPLVLPKQKVARDVLMGLQAGTRRITYGKIATAFATLQNGYYLPCDVFSAFLEVTLSGILRLVAILIFCGWRVSYLGLPLNK